MERSEIRGSRSRRDRFPDCAALHPGYGAAFAAFTDHALELARLSRWSRPIRLDVVRVLPVEQILPQDKAASAPDRHALDLSGVLGRQSSGMSTPAERRRRECNFKDAQYRQHACPCHRDTSRELFSKFGQKFGHLNLGIDAGVRLWLGR